MTPSAESQPDRAAGPDRITTTLIPRAARELAAMQDATGLSRSDLVNRAISLYAFATGQMDAGLELALRDPSTGDTQVVHLL